MVKWLAECERIFSCPMPKYTLSAPACKAAANDSLDPTGAIISKSFIVAIAFWGYLFCGATAEHLTAYSL